MNDFLKIGNMPITEWKGSESNEGARSQRNGWEPNGWIVYGRARKGSDRNGKFPRTTVQLLYSIHSTYNLHIYCIVYTVYCILYSV